MMPQMPVYLLDLNISPDFDMFDSVAGDSRNPQLTILCRFTKEEITGSKDTEAVLITCNKVCKQLMAEASLNEQTKLEINLEGGNEIVDEHLKTILKPSNVSKCEILSQIKRTMIHIYLPSDADARAAAIAEKTGDAIQALNFCRDLNELAIRYELQHKLRPLQPQGDMRPTIEKLKLIEFPYDLQVITSVPLDRRNAEARYNLYEAWRQSPGRAENKARRAGGQQGID